MRKGTTTYSNDLLLRLKEEGIKALEPIYEAYRVDFLQFAKRYELPEADVLDAYQDAIISFYENVVEDKLTEMSSSPKTYIFSIGKYILLNRRKNKNRFTDTSELLEVAGKLTDNQLYKSITLTDQQRRIESNLNRIGEQCKKLLQLFYYQRYSIQSIQREMGYSSENTVKASKSRCMQSLRKVMENDKDLN